MYKNYILKIMNNLQKTILLAFVALISTTTFAQKKHPDHEKMKALKVAFITEKLEFTSDEAKAFWPIYNDYETKLYDLYRKRRKSMREYRALENPSEKHATAQLTSHFTFEKEKDQLMEAYFTKISKHISVKKTFRLIRAEEEFKRQLIQQYRGKRKTEKKKP